MGVPEVYHPGIGHELRIPAGALIASQNLEPDGEHAELGVGMFFEDFFLHPPGARPADGSAGREEEDQTREVAIGVEHLPELGGTLEVAQPEVALADGGVGGRSGSRAVYAGPEQERKDQEEHDNTDWEATGWPTCYCSGPFRVLPMPFAGVRCRCRASCAVDGQETTRDSSPCTRVALRG